MSDEKKVTFSKNAVIVFDVTEKAIVDLEQLWQAEAIPKDLSIKEDYELVKNGVATIRKLRSAVETRRKELKKDALEYGKQVDLTAKGISERLLAIETPIKLAKTTYDEKIEIAKREKLRLEEERVDAISLRIANIRALVEAHISSDAATIRRVIVETNDGWPCEWAEEFQEKANSATIETMAKLEELFSMKEQSENAAKTAKEAEDKRLADEEKARIIREKDAEALAEKNAAEKKKLDAERAAFQKEKDDHQAKVAGEEKKRLDGIAAEEKKKADKTAKEEEKKRLADIEKKRKADTAKAKKEVEKRTKEAFDSIIAAISSDGSIAEKATNVIEAIKAGKVPHVTFE